ncbi:kinase-like protein [Ceratobasidium sp. AG-I]|nr:kinase-like protein [Ceratobasidium sp. AG-I]
MRIFIGSPGEQKHLKHAALEIHTWSKLEHRHVLKLLGMVMFRGQIGMVSPWVTRGSLNKYLAGNTKLNRPQLCTQVADGLAYLHSCGVVHGDLKGANVLLSDDDDPLLTDFGNAVLQERTLQFTYTTTKASLSPRWAAPELIRGEESFSFEADVFALGMIVQEIITGSVPYSGVNDLGVMFAIAQGRFPKRPEDSIPTKSKHGNALWSILARCWHGEAKSRPSASAVKDEVGIYRVKPVPRRYLIRLLDDDDSN